MLFFSLLYLILRPLKGGHIELTEQNNELESNALSNNPVDAKDATTEETTNASQELESTPETVKEEVAQSEESESEATPQAVVTSDEDATVEEVGTNTSQELESTPEPVTEVVAPSEKSESKASPKAVINSDDDEDDEDEYKPGTKNYKNVPDPVHDENAFDWTMDKEGFGKYDDSNKSELEQLYMDSFNSIEEGTIIKGIVVSLSKKDVIVNVGFKSDGLVSRTEFKDRPELAVGDEVQVYVVETEDALGQLVLSRKKAQAETAWENIILAQTDGSIVTGLIKSRTKGGLVVDIMGLDAFLPGSQIDVKPIRDYDQYVGQRMEFKVVKINEAFKNVVISHKALIEDDIEAQKGEILSKLEKGQVLEGVVKNMTSFGVFIDLGGLDGLLHITDVSWGRINHPEEVLQLDQKINIVVLDFDDDKKRISLGLKQLTPHPWDNLSDKLEVNAKVKGKVVTVADYGAFIEIAPGIEGLIHVSEMSWSQHLRNPQDFMNVGDEVEAVILTLEKEEHKMSLGIKQLTPDPWDNIEEKYPAESKHKGIVRNLTNYGLFVELEEGVDGLVHVSDLSWSKKIKHPAEFTKKGEELEVVVLEIDRENRRLSLGHKQLDENPWETFESIFTEGSEHEGTIAEINDKGATVALPYGVEGFAPTKHLKKEDKSVVKPDEALNFRIIEFNKDQKRIIVSHTDIWKEEERARVDSDNEAKVKSAKKTTRSVEKMNRGNDFSTLGELDELAELKAKMEAASRKSAVEKLAKIADDKDEKPAAKAKPKAEAKPKVNVEAEAEAEAEAKPKAKAKATESTSDDDLKLLNGVGPALAKKMTEAGFTNFAQIAALDEAEVTAMEEAIGKAEIFSKNGWSDQLKELMS